MQQEENLPRAMLWGILLSIPLWVSFFGWIKIFFLG